MNTVNVIAGGKIIEIISDDFKVSIVANTITMFGTVNDESFCILVKGKDQVIPIQDLNEGNALADVLSGINTLSHFVQIPDNEVTSFVDTQYVAGVVQHDNKIYVSFTNTDKNLQFYHADDAKCDRYYGDIVAAIASKM